MILVTEFCQLMCVTCICCHVIFGSLSVTQINLFIKLVRPISVQLYHLLWPCTLGVLVNTIDYILTFT